MLSDTNCIFIRTTTSLPAPLSQTMFLALAMPMLAQRFLADALVLEVLGYSAPIRSVFLDGVRNKRGGTSDMDAEKEEGEL
jgi:hypothetical protein